MSVCNVLYRNTAYKFFSFTSVPRNLLKHSNLVDILNVIVKGESIFNDDSNIPHKQRKILT